VKHRRLMWYYSHGQATIRGNFRLKPIEIVCSTTQGAVLLLFNSGTALSQGCCHTCAHSWSRLGTY
jgi:cullin 1